jgi:hypothetical protein
MHTNLFRKLAPCLAVVLNLYCAVAAAADQAAPAQENAAAQSASLDDFINRSLGDEVPAEKLQGTGAYRARQVEKTIWRLIDTKGYYRPLAKDFSLWCASHSGNFELQEAGGNCTDKADPNVWIAGYRIVIKTTAAYEGRMTAGYARIFFMRGEEMKVVSEREKAEAKAIADEDSRQKQCYQDWLAEVRTNPKPGMKATVGLIIDSKLPLVQIQNLRASPPVRWVNAADLRPDPAGGYCH